MNALPNLTLDTLKREAKTYAQALSSQAISALYGVTDGKAVGTYVEQGFRAYLHSRYMFVPGSAAQGIDFPELLVDLKVTSINQPQSSCPFRDAHQKVYGWDMGCLLWFMIRLMMLLQTQHSCIFGTSFILYRL